VSDRYDNAVDMLLGKNIRRNILERLGDEDGLGKLLELGCGTGYFTPTLANKSEMVIATDISEEMLEIAWERVKENGKVQFQVMDCLNCKFDKGTFDTVFMGLVLLFVEEPEKALKEILRILKPGGLLIMADPDISQLSNEGREKFVSRALKNFHKMPPVNRMFNQKELTEILDKVGFNVVTKEIILDASDKNSASANYIKAKSK